MEEEEEEEEEKENESVQAHGSVHI